MIYAVRLYTVDVPRVPGFMSAFRPRGLWTEIARIQPGYIHTDLLRNPSDSSRFLSIEFWTSIQALLVARRSPELRSFARWLSRQTIECEGVGMFVFPPQPERVPGELLCVSGSRIGEQANSDSQFSDEVRS